FHASSPLHCLPLLPLLLSSGLLLEILDEGTTVLDKTEFTLKPAFFKCLTHELPVIGVVVSHHQNTVSAHVRRESCEIPVFLRRGDRESRRRNSSHVRISYCVFC